MVRELGMNPKKFGKLDNYKQEPSVADFHWKSLFQKTSQREAGKCAVHRTDGERQEAETGWTQTAKIKGRRGPGNAVPFWKTRISIPWRLCIFGPYCSAPQLPVLFAISCRILYVLSISNHTFFRFRSHGKVHIKRPDNPTIGKKTNWTSDWKCSP